MNLQGIGLLPLAWTRDRGHKPDTVLEWDGVSESSARQPVGLSEVYLGKGPLLGSRYRPDLSAAGIGSGRQCFCVDWDEPLSLWQGHIVDVRRSSDGATPWGSPQLVAAVIAAA